jgi:dihydrodipicolinate synthase/N-acetylneuraminate lyase
MKAAEGSCEKVVEYVRTLGPDYAVMSGDDGLTLPFMSAGARGVISVASNLVVQPLCRNGTFGQYRRLHGCESNLPEVLPALQSDFPRAKSGADQVCPQAGRHHYIR